MESREVSSHQPAGKCCENREDAIKTGATILSRRFVDEQSRMRKSLKKMTKNDSSVSKVSLKSMKIQRMNLTNLVPTTIGTKFSVLQIIRIPSLMRCGFDH